MIRALHIDEDAKRRVARVLKYARCPENFFEPGKTVLIPGNDGNLQVHLNTYRCVFSYTKCDGKLWRHLSISVPGGLFPNIFAGFTIAEMFGFTGWDQKSEVPPEDWICKPVPKDRCVVLAQALPDGVIP